MPAWRRPSCEKLLHHPVLVSREMRCGQAAFILLRSILCLHIRAPARALQQTLPISASPPSRCVLILASGREKFNDTVVTVDCAGISPEHLDQATAPAPKDEQVPAMRITPQRLLNHERQSIKSLTHVGMVGRQPNPRRSAPGSSPALALGQRLHQRRHRQHIDRSGDPHPTASRKLDLNHAGSLGYRWQRRRFGRWCDCNRIERRRNLRPLRAAGASEIIGWYRITLGLGFTSAAILAAGWRTVISAGLLAGRSESRHFRKLSTPAVASTDG